MLTKAFLALFNSLKQDYIFDKDWNSGWADFGNGLIVYDKDVVKLAMKHLRLRDYINPHKVYVAMMYAFDILSKSTEAPKGNYRWFK